MRSDTKIEFRCKSKERERVKKNAEKQGKELQKQLNEDAKKIVRLETELKDK